MSRKGRKPQNIKKAHPPQKHRYLIAGCFIAAAVVLPLIVRLKEAKLSGRILEIVPSRGGVSTDLTLYYKSFALICLAVLLCLFFAGERIYPEHKIPTAFSHDTSSRLYLFPAAGYGLLAALSCLFSGNRNTALFGAPNSYEGTLVLLSYVVLFLMAVNYFEDPFYLSALIRVLPFLFVCFILYGLTEYFCRSPLSMKAIGYLILPPTYWKQAGHLQLSAYFGRISLTLANPDYAGEFLVMAAPLCMMIAKSREGLQKQFFRVLSAGLLFVLLLTRSYAAIAAAAVSLLILLCVFRRRAAAFILPVSLSVLALVLLIAGALAVKRETPLAFFTSGKAAAVTSKSRYTVRNIRIEGDEILFTGAGCSLTLRDTDSGLRFFDTTGNPVGAQADGNVTRLTDRAYPVRVTSDGEFFTVDLGYRSPVSFVFEEGKIYAVGVNGTLLRDVSDTSSFGFQKFQTFATGRGYIWSKSLPLLKSALLLGYGADCTLYHIPQNDYAGKLNTQGSVSVVIDKPHNLFLQIALNTGIPSLLLILVIFAAYLRSCLLLFREPDESADGTVFNCAAGILAGVSGYLLCGLFYDSSITTAPFFWLILGVGVALNGRLARTGGRP